MEEDSSDEELCDIDLHAHNKKQTRELDEELDMEEVGEVLANWHTMEEDDDDDDDVVGGCKDDELPHVGGDPVIQRDTLWELFRYTTIPTLKQAARMLNVGATQLKRICRAHGVSRWPKRRLDSARAVVAHHKRTGNLQESRKVQEELNKMYLDPEREIGDLLAKSRQKKFKECHKARKRGGSKKRRESLLGVRQ